MPSAGAQPTFLAYIYSLPLLSLLVIDSFYTFSQVIKTPLSSLFLPSGSTNSYIVFTKTYDVRCVLSLMA